MDNQFDLTWQGEMAFRAEPPSGNGFTMDAYSDSGGQDLGPTPLEAFLSSVAACTAMDVISILKKKQQKVSGYQVRVEWERGPEGEYPRPVTAIRLTHIVTGESIDPAAVQRAIELSDEKYCAVAATLRIAPPIKTGFEIVAPVA